MIPNVQENDLTLRRGRMHCIRFGAGQKPALLIAGMSMAGLAGLGNAIAEAYAIFAEDYTFYTFDRLDVLPDGYTVHDMAEDIAESMEQLNISAAYVAGASQGGMIALDLAANHPEKVLAVAPAAACAYQNPIGQTTFREWIRLADNRDGRGIYRDFFARVYTRPNPELLKLLEDTGTDEQCRRFGIEADACLNFDIRSTIGNIRCPALVIGAREDKVLSAEASETLAELLRCECVIYEGFGHAVFDESPAFKPRLKAFFDSVSIS